MLVASEKEFRTYKLNTGKLLRSFTLELDQNQVFQHCYFSKKSINKIFSLTRDVETEDTFLLKWEMREGEEPD